MDGRVSSRTDRRGIYCRAGIEPGKPSEGCLPDINDHTVGVPVYRNRIGLEVDS